MFPEHTEMRSVIANQLFWISRPTQRLESFNYFLVEPFFFFFPLFCPPKFGIKEEEKCVNKNFGKLLQPCSSWRIQQPGQMGRPRAQEQQHFGELLLKTKIGLEMGTA